MVCLIVYFIDILIDLEYMVQKKEVGSRNRAYTKEFKSKIINKIFEGSSIDELSAKYLLSNTIVIIWIKQYNKYNK